MVQGKVILLVEDDPDDELLTLRALRKNQIANEVVVARDGVEALDFLSGTGAFAGRDANTSQSLRRQIHSSRSLSRSWPTARL